VQLNDTLAKTYGQEPSFKVFKVTGTKESEAIGHVQLMDIDYDKSTCTLGRALVFAACRGRGLGKEMIQCAVEYALNCLDLNEITLGVFDFNLGAIATYKRVGFVEYQFIEDARQYRNEQWNLIKMKLNKGQWLLNKK